jgi:hypothetical protein
MIAMDLSRFNAVDWTAGAVMLGALAMFVALSTGAPASLVIQRTKEPMRRVRWVTRCVAAGILLSVTVLSASVGAWLFWTAHRGDYRPYASVRAQARPGCRRDAERRDPTGANRDRYITECVDRAVAAAEDD